MADEIKPSGITEAVRLARATPWKAAIEIRRLLVMPFVRAYFAAHGIAWGSGWRIYGRPVIQRHRGSRIIIGDSLELRNWVASSPLGVDHRCMLTTWSAGAVIEIGRGVGITGGAICANESIRIGDRVRIGANCTIVDTDFHPLEASARMTSPAAGAGSPVTIGDEAFIGMQVMILKGSRIGSGAVIGAGSVVAGEIPPRVIAAGNPARVLREL
jgi:acetyltransferase-like isoleucine patch superfamily enzyme